MLFSASMPPGHLWMPLALWSRSPWRWKGEGFPACNQFVIIFTLLQHCMSFFPGTFWYFPRQTQSTQLLKSMGTSLLDVRLGGRVLSCGKLDGAMEALDLECTSRDVLLVTSQLGDLIEAALGIQGGKMLRNWCLGGRKIVLNWFGCEISEISLFTLKLDLKWSFFDNRHRFLKSWRCPMKKIASHPNLMSCPWWRHPNPTETCSKRRPPSKVLMYANSDHGWLGEQLHLVMRQIKTYWNPPRCFCC